VGQFVNGNRQAFDAKKLKPFIPTTTIAWTVLMLHFVTGGLISMKARPAVFSKNQT